MIASSLGIKAAEVDGYLGIKVAAPARQNACSVRSVLQIRINLRAVAETKPEAPEATVQSSPAPQPVGIKASTAQS